MSKIADVSAKVFAKTLTQPLINNSVYLIMILLKLTIRGGQRKPHRS